MANVDASMCVALKGLSYIRIDLNKGFKTTAKLIYMKHIPEAYEN